MSGLHHWVLGQDGEPRAADAMEWARWFEVLENRVVASDEVCGCDVSTIFLGIDHSFGRGGPPVLWETMAFAARPVRRTMPGMMLDGWWRPPSKYTGRASLCQVRYSSRAEALAGHAAVVEWCRSLTPLDLAIALAEDHARWDGRGYWARRRRWLAARRNRGIARGRRHEPYTLDAFLTPFQQSNPQHTE